MQKDAPDSKEINKTYTTILNQAFKKLVLGGDLEKLNILLEKFSFAEEIIIDTYREAAKNRSTKAIQILRAYTNDKIQLPLKEKLNALQFAQQYHVPKLQDALLGPLPILPIRSFIVSSTQPPLKPEKEAPKKEQKKHPHDQKHRS